MDNNQMLNMMMQMLMNQNQMMSMMLGQMNQPQPITTPTISFETQGVTNDINSQLEALRSEIQSLKTELAAAKQTGEAYKKSYEHLQKTYSDELSGFSQLKKTVSKAEAYLGQSIEDVAAQGENLSGDDYYDKKKEEWDKEGVPNKERYERTKAFKDAYKTEEDPWGPMIEF